MLYVCIWDIWMMTDGEVMCVLYCGPWTQWFLLFLDLKKKGLSLLWPMLKLIRFSYKLKERHYVLWIAKWCPLTVDFYDPFLLLYEFHWLDNWCYLRKKNVHVFMHRYQAWPPRKTKPNKTEPQKKSWCSPKTKCVHLDNLKVT